MKIELTEKQTELFSGLRSKMYDIICYLSEQETLTILESINAQHYAFIKHNKDLKDDGTPKKEHIHIVLVDDTRRRAIRLCRLFNTTELRAITNTEQLSGSFLYLTHESKKAIAENKIIYDSKNIISNDIDWFRKFNSDISDGVDNSINILNDINNETKTRDMVKKYGREFIYHFHSYQVVAERIRYEENKNLWCTRLSLTDIETGEIIKGGFPNGKQN